jgi:AAA family ATP:ADP antiporter
MRLVKTFRDQPYLVHVALIVFLSTATLLLIDYFFKSTIARDLPAAEVGPRIASCYLAFNIVSLFVQVFLGSATVQRLGVTGALVLTPSLLLLGAGGAFFTAGAMAAVLVLKGIDGSLRHSLHRITGELTYLPLSPETRGRAKPLIDGALGRAAQTITGGALLVLGGTTLLAPRPLAIIVACGAGAWLFAAIGLRRPYLALLRNAISAGAIEVEDCPGPLDRGTQDFLVRHLASADPIEVVAAMDALERRKRADLILPALVLVNEDESVLTRALQIFGGSERSDWIPLAIRALEHPRTAVRLAAARALAKHDRFDGTELASDSRARIRGYAAVWHALREGRDLFADRRVAELRSGGRELGEATTLGMLAAMGDAPPSESARGLLRVLSQEAFQSPEGIDLLAQAVARQRDRTLIDRLVPHLAVRSGREAIRAALVTLGDAAFDSLSATLGDETQPRRLRIHLPKTLARFGDARAVDRLLDCIERERDGLVRYKAIRALGILTRTQRVAADRVRVERLCATNLHVYFRLLALRTALAPAGDKAGRESRSLRERLLIRLLDDKLDHSLERAFRLLKAAHPREDVHRVHLACMSEDTYARANAGELLDALLHHLDQQPLRELLRLVADDLPATERLRRFRMLVDDGPVRNAGEALAVLRASSDPMVAALANQDADVPQRRTSPEGPPAQEQTPHFEPTGPDV